MDDVGDLAVSGVLVSDADAAFSLDLGADANPDIEIFGASVREFLDDSFSLFFEDATNGYLFTFVSDFGDPDTELFAEAGSLAVEVFSVTAVDPVPLPAGLPLILAGLGSFYMVGRRRKSA